jgi:hypothetical protein
VLLLKTFLFITCDGTPEGDKLRKILGLSKWDKKYLAIDRLSSFLNSDIQENAGLCEIFKEADCGQLLSITDKLLASGKKHIHHADLIKYLGLYERFRITIIFCIVTFLSDFLIKF